MLVLITKVYLKFQKSEFNWFFKYIIKGKMGMRIWECKQVMHSVYEYNTASISALAAVILYYHHDTL